MFIKIVSYNILADYLNDPTYMLVKKKYLDNKYRLYLLTEKIKKIISDKTVFCFQEVGPIQLSTLYLFFKKLNFESISYSGLAIFYHKSFTVKFLEINSIWRLHKDLPFKKKNKLVESIKNFKHPYIILGLASKNKSFTIATTHIVANPKFERIKVIQSFLVAKRISCFPSPILCGDFNSVPSSDTYKLLSEGTLKYPGYGELKLRCKLQSSYKLIHGEEKNITTHTSNLTTEKFTETIDYIWIGKGIKVESTIPIVTKEEIENTDFMPNKTEPSDHFLIKAVLKI